MACCGAKLVTRKKFRRKETVAIHRAKLTSWIDGGSYLTQCIKSTPPQNRQLNILMSHSEQEVDDFVGGVDIVKLINQDIM